MLEPCLCFFSMLEQQVFSTPKSKGLEPKYMCLEQRSAGRAHLTTSGCGRGAIGHPHYRETSPGGSCVLTRRPWTSPEPVPLPKL